MENSAATTTETQGIPLKTWAETNDVVQVVDHVRKNVSGYLYITFIKRGNIAENVYFSKSAALKHGESERVDKAFMANKRIFLVKNAAGEERTKLGLDGDSMRVDILDVL